MDSILDLLDSLFYGVYYNAVEPLLLGIAYLLRLSFSPLTPFHPIYQILGIAAAGAILSILLARRFRSPKENSLREAFRKKLATLGTTSAIGDKRTEKLVRGGISQEADKIYEQLILDKFIEMGISYFFPMFFFLIWIEYDAFSPENLKLLTGSAFAWVTDSGAQISAAYLYTWFFNGFLFSFYVLRAGLRFFFNRGIFKVKLATNESAAK